MLLYSYIDQCYYALPQRCDAIWKHLKQHKWAICYEWWNDFLAKMSIIWSAVQLKCSKTWKVLSGWVPLTNEFFISLVNKMCETFLYPETKCWCCYISIFPFWLVMVVLPRGIGRVDGMSEHPLSWGLVLLIRAYFWSIYWKTCTS